MSRRSASDSVARRGRRHLELAQQVEEWPDDLLTLLGQARQGYLAAEPMPQPSAAVAAFMQVPAHGVGEFVPAPTAVLVEPDLDAEEIELSLLSARPAAPPVRRPLVALGGAAAAIVLVALGVRPMLSASAADAQETPATSIAWQPVAPTTIAPDADDALTPTATTVPATTAPSAPAPSAPVATTPAAPATTPAAPAAPATTAKSSSKSSTKKTTATTAPATTKPAPAPPAVRPAPAAPPTPAPPVGMSSREAVLRYYDLANDRGKCVAKQPKGASRTQLIAACGAEPVPPANLVQYWAAKDVWGRCADPLLAKGWKQSKVEASCGAKPDRSTYDVPLNPYS